ncbi:MAG: DNA mismatch repair protein MutS [Acidobacteria bacterium]|nr:MAG: DNA mismatch repair protein MutS [Acidobacteriota bacterium]
MPFNSPNVHDSCLLHIMAPVSKREPKKHHAHVHHRDDAADAAAFAREMADVVRLRPDPRGRLRLSSVPAPASPSSRTRPAHAATTSPADEGSNEDFIAPGVDRRELRKLKRGEYKAGDRRDLHGMTAAEACASVQRFIANSRHRRYRCVCIVHGRGWHSAAGTASVVKTRVRESLRANPVVLAFADAPPSDGGAGAVYVLLRT